MRVTLGLLASFVVASCALSAAGAARQPRGRGLLQQAANCSRLVHPACSSCLKRRYGQDGKTRWVCRTCMPGYDLRDSDPLQCDCEAGFMRVNGTQQCVPCSRGLFCLGAMRNGTALPTPCPDGLATVIVGARSAAQCFAIPGYGRTSTKDARGNVVYWGVLCSKGTFNVGGNTRLCQTCPQGLTTQSAGADSASDCLAPPGSYMDAGIGKLCPKGTYQPGFTSAPSCTPCEDGVTTAREGRTSEDDCGLVERGYFWDEGERKAVPCPLNTYQDEESDASECKPCPDGLRTQEEGAEGLDECMAPPGYQPGAGNISACERGWFKEGWSRQACKPCATGLDTAAEASTSDDECYVPPGWGAVWDTNGTVSAVPCVSNTYGDNEPLYNVRRAVCSPCLPNTYTPDVLTGVPPADGIGYQSVDACMVAPGFGFDADTLVEPCEVGTFSTGMHRLPCTNCPSGFTTLDTGSTSEVACVVKPGWAYSETMGLASPCDAGTYGTGGSADDRFGSCSSCPEGFSTQEDGATSIDDCDVCSAGHGGANCTVCGVGTYSTGGAARACTDCPAGTTSQLRATDSSLCLPVWPLATAASTVHIVLSNTSLWADLAGGSASEEACMSRCEAEERCIVYRFREASPAACQGYSAVPATTPGAAALGFKAYGGGGSVANYAIYYVPLSVQIGTQLQNIGSVPDAAACSAACTASGECLLVRVVASNGQLSCTTYGGSLDADWVGGYKVVGGALAANTGIQVDLA